MTLLATHAPGVAARPLRRESDAHGTPVVVMERVPGEPLGGAALTIAQTTSLGNVLRKAYGVPLHAVRDSGIGERLYGPSVLPDLVGAWFNESGDISQCHDSALVRRAMDEGLRWLAEPGALPEPRLSGLGLSDRKLGNVLWDGATCRLVDFEDGGLSDPAYELADLLEHIAGRGLVDSATLLDAVGFTGEQRDRVQAYRPLWASFWLAMLLPGNSGFQRNPPGTTENQARHLLGLVG